MLNQNAACGGKRVIIPGTGLRAKSVAPAAVVHRKPPFAASVRKIRGTHQSSRRLGGRHRFLRLRRTLVHNVFQSLDRLHRPPRARSERGPLYRLVHPRTDFGICHRNCPDAAARRPDIAARIGFAVFMGIAIYGTQTLSQALYEARPIGLWLIDAGYVLIGFAIMGAIIGAWEKRGAATE
ncbi:MAG: hypothetical protein DLM50_00985 [Candidatus Meridianibacter frigidus]|nr:MAG: hypothetical protein DLM50_00985 [Candidatus Eremiobacteraeota bacterium]